MAGKSFYDLDYMIEINEQRLEQYKTASEKVMDRLTNHYYLFGDGDFFRADGEDGILEWKQRLDFVYILCIVCSVAFHIGILRCAFDDPKEFGFTTNSDSDLQRLPNKLREGDK